uniref:DUF6279 family lipoprotein n=1 Tax=Ningiella ruwaisensis TaxID=2364274 RepID=UPI0010A036DC|nr:DUF6279 family lipoprotein [Ningiella ruwaisensis]
MKKIIVLLTVFLVAGCSTKFAYKNIDWLVYWYIDDYIDMTKAQEQQFDTYLEQWLSWHKRSELPLYLAHLEELKADIASQNISIAQMDYHQEKAREHWTRFRAHIAPDLAQLATTLSDEQVVYLFAALEKENLEDEEEREERAKRSEKRKKADWLDRNEDNLEKWLGNLTDEQETFVENSYGNFSSTSQYWLEYKRNYQQALRKVFSQAGRGEEFTSRLAELLTDPERFRSDEMQAVSARNESASKQYLLTIFSLSTEKQRQHLIEEIDSLRDDITELAN